MHLFETKSKVVSFTFLVIKRQRSVNFKLSYSQCHGFAFTFLGLHNHKLFFLIILTTIDYFLITVIFFYLGKL